MEGLASCLGPEKVTLIDLVRARQQEVWIASWMVSLDR